MRVKVINRFGDPSVFESMELPKPNLKPGHVLIKVNATSVNQIDCKIRSGAVTNIAPPFPAILHGDVAGVISVASPDVWHFESGDEVYACAGGVKGCGGALAEYMLVDAALIAKKPRKLSMLEAAALPLVGITAWDALVNRAHLTKGQSILIHGGVGGVGHIALQLANSLGAHVSTTVLKPEEEALAKSLGAHEVILAAERPEEYVARITKGRGFDVVFDTIGGAHLNESFIAAGIGGIVVTTAARSTNDLTLMHNKGLTLHVVFMLLPLLKGLNRAPYGDLLEKLARMVDAGQIKPLIDTSTFTLNTISEAHRHLESGQARGKVVVEI